MLVVTLCFYFSLAGVLFFKLAFWNCFANTRYAFILFFFFFFLINVQGYELSFIGIYVGCTSCAVFSLKTVLHSLLLTVTGDTNKE